MVILIQPDNASRHEQLTADDFQPVPYNSTENQVELQKKYAYTYCVINKLDQNYKNYTKTCKKLLNFSLYNKNDMYAYINALYGMELTLNEIIDGCYCNIFLKNYFSNNEIEKNERSFMEEQENFSYEVGIILKMDKRFMNESIYVYYPYLFLVLKNIFKTYFEKYFGVEPTEENFIDIINANRHILSIKYPRGIRSGRVICRMKEEYIENTFHKKILDAELTRIVNMFNEGYFTNKKAYYSKANEKNYYRYHKKYNWNPFDDSIDFI